MISFQPTDEELAIAATVRSFVDRELMPLEPVMIQRGLSGQQPILTDDEITKLRAKARNSGLWGIDTPEEYGGANLGWVAQALVNMELGHTFTRFSFGGSAPEILYLLNDEQKQRYLIPTIENLRTGCFALSEPGGGSDAANVKTSAVRDGNSWLINGEKMWISSGNEADYALVFCRTPGESVVGLTAFLVDRAMGWKSTPIPVMGSQQTATLSFVDVRVPDANRFGDVGSGLQYAMQFVHRNRAIVLPARAIGACQRMIEMGFEWASNRITMGEPLINRENIKFALAESEIELKAMKLLMLHAAWTHEAGQDPRQAANTIKFYEANAANRIVDRIVQVFGGMGYAKELPIERLYRELRVERIYEGSDEMQLLAIARNLVKGHVGVGQIW
jgi:acyl-CoA dehydrogenase